MKNALIDRQRLAAIEARTLAATGGPWRALLEGQSHSSGSSCIATATGAIDLDGASDADIEFMAKAREDVPFLVSELRRLAALVEGA